MDKPTFQEFVESELKLYHERVKKGIGCGGTPIDKRRLKKLRKEINEIPYEKQLEIFMERYASLKDASFIKR